ncbi:S-adenosylmethionine decarboxylase [Psychromonas aquimarina]|uniref:S-adenosylmethionine decarboxylase n=1 Tax=Psychromonas aquimarina TaxID=444919 RepID=UPI00040CA0DD|nr:S-adenosylmethionine decarboxylase [Psychromonas aquimarina]
MFYEGTEKRLQITLQHSNLLQFPDSFWQEMVRQAGALILSKIENAQVKAYLLSESSLFVWKNKLLLITCGNTHLVKAAQFFQKELGKENIHSLLFHRHQPHQPDLQATNFTQDVSILNSHLQGSTKHWRGKYQGDLFLFGEASHGPADTKQILMCHGLSGSFANSLQAGTVSTKQIECALALPEFFPQLHIDQFTFTPKGYSLNAVSEEHYLTVHITPETLSTYFSLESSFDNQLMQPFIGHLSTLFRPSQSHLMSFNASAENCLQVTLSDPDELRL